VDFRETTVRTSISCCGRRVFIEQSTQSLYPVGLGQVGMLRTGLVSGSVVAVNDFFGGWGPGIVIILCGVVVVTKWRRQKHQDAESQKED
jgi:hypothetical protein